jgi:hypothetical protein
MPPGFRGKPSPLVRAKDAKGHDNVSGDRGM